MGIRVYADTSIFGGVFDEEFREASEVFFDQVRSGQFALVTSAVVLEEMAQAPTEVQRGISADRDLFSAGGDSL